MRHMRSSSDSVGHDDWLMAWLKRLRFSGVPSPTLATLGKIIGAHQEQFPFENISVFCGEIPSLEPAALVEKLVFGGRGGYCFELNRLLALGLECLGYNVVPMMARVIWGRDEPGPLTHFLLRVSVDGEDWLVDAGFGGPGPSGPIRLTQPLSIFLFDGVNYRVDVEANFGRVLMRLSNDGGWEPLYAFTDELVGDDEIDAGNRLAASGPGSIFRKSLMAARRKGSGRIVLSGSRFRCYEGTRLLDETEIADSTQKLECLESEFGINLDDLTKGALLKRL